jgi:hypothetical protein
VEWKREIAQYSQLSTSHLERFEGGQDVCVSRGQAQVRSVKAGQLDALDESSIAEREV